MQDGYQGRTQLRARVDDSAGVEERHEIVSDLIELAKEGLHMSISWQSVGVQWYSCYAKKQAQSSFATDALIAFGAKAQKCFLAFVMQSSDWFEFCAGIANQSCDSLRISDQWDGGGP